MAKEELENENVEQTGNEDRVITVQYLSETKVTDFMEYIKSLDFSKLKAKTLYTIN